MDSEDYTLYRNLLGELVGDMNTLIVPQDALVGKLKALVNATETDNAHELTRKLECVFGEVIDKIVEEIGHNKSHADLDYYRQLASIFGKNATPDTSFTKYTKTAESLIGDLTEFTDARELRSYLKELLQKLYAKQVSQGSNSDISQNTLSLNSIKPFLQVPERQLGLQDLSSIQYSSPIDLKFGSQLFDSKDDTYLEQYEGEKPYITVIMEEAKHITASDSSKLNSEDSALSKVISEETNNNSVQDAVSHNSEGSAVNEPGDDLTVKDSSRHNSEDPALNEPTESELTHSMRTSTPTTQIDSRQLSCERIECISVLENYNANSNENKDNSISRGSHPPPKAEMVEFPVISEIIESLVKSLNSFKSQENSSPENKMLNKHLSDLKALESEFAGDNSSLLTSERLRSKLLPTLQNIAREHNLDSHLLDSLLELLNNPSLLTAQILKQIPDDLDASSLNAFFSTLMAQAAEHVRDPTYYLAQQKLYESLPICYLGQQMIPQYIQSISRIDSDNTGIDPAQLQDARNKLEQLIKYPSALSGAIEEFIKGLQFQGNSIRPLNSLFCTLATQATIHIKSSKEDNKIQSEKAEELLRFYDSFIENMGNANEEGVEDSFKATQLHSLFDCNHRLINDYEYLANESSENKPAEDIGNLKKLLIQMNGINDAIYEEENEDLEDLSNYPAHVIQLIHELKNQLSVTTDPQDIAINNEIQQTLKRELDMIYRNLEEGKDDKNYKVKLLQDLAEGYQFIYDVGNKGPRIQNKIDKYRKYAEEFASAKSANQDDNLIKPLPFDYKELIKLFNFLINSSHTLKSTISNKDQGGLGRLNKMIAMYRGLIASIKLGMQKGLSNNPLNKAFMYYKKMIGKVLKDLNSIETKLETTTIREFDNAIAKAGSLLDKLNGIEDILQINSAADAEEIQGVLGNINGEYEKLKVFVHRKETNDIEESIFQNSRLIERLKATQMFMHRTNSSSQEKITMDYLEVYMPDLLKESENVITERASMKCSPDAVIKGIVAWKVAASAIKGNTEQEYLVIIKGVIDIIRWHEEILTLRTGKDLDTFSTHISLSHHRKLLSSLRKFYHSTVKAKKKHSNTDLFSVLSGLVRNLNFILKEKKRLREDTRLIEQYLSHYTQLVATKQDSTKTKQKTVLKNLSSHSAGELSQIYCYISDKLPSLREYPPFRALISTHKANFEQNKSITGFTEELESILCTIKSSPRKELEEILRTIETMLTELSTLQASPALHEASLRGLHEIFAFYSCNSPSLSLQNFLLFGSDFGVMDLQTSRSKKMIRIDTAKKFFQQLSQDSRTISEQEFSTLLEKLSHLYFDETHSHSKFAAFLELLGCHEPQQYQKTLANSQCQQGSQLSPEKSKEASLVLRRLPTYHSSPHSKTSRNNTQLSRITGKPLFRSPTLLPHDGLEFS